MSTSLPTHGTTGLVPPQAGASFYLPTARRVLDPRLKWPPTDEAAPAVLTRAPSSAETRFEDPTELPTPRGTVEANEVQVLSREAAASQPQQQQPMRRAQQGERKQTEDKRTTFAERHPLQQAYAASTAPVYSVPIEEKSSAAERRGNPPSELQSFLSPLGLSSLVDSLSREGVSSVNQLPFLSGSDLRDLGLNMAQRLELRRALANKGHDVSASMMPTQEEKQPRQQQSSTRGRPAIPKLNLPPQPQPQSSRSLPSDRSSERSQPQQPASAVSTGRAERRRKQKLRERVAAPVGHEHRSPSLGTAFASVHPPHPSHPTTMYDYVSEAPPLHALHYPASSRKSSSAGGRAICPPQTPVPQPSAPTSPLSQFTSAITPRAETPRYRYLGPAASTLAPLPYASPPLEHAADYPLDTPTHGAHPELIHRADGTTDFAYSRHPPHMSHPMPPSDIVPHARHARFFTHPPHPSHPPSPAPGIYSQSRRPHDTLASSQQNAFPVVDTQRVAVV